MAAPARPPLLPGPAPSRADVWRQWLLGTFPGRSLLIDLVNQMTIEVASPW